MSGIDGLGRSAPRNLAPTAETSPPVPAPPPNSDHFEPAIAEIFGGRRPGGPSDVELLQAMIQGQLPVEEGLLRVAYSGGWPLATPEGYYYASAGPGPMALAGDHNRWRPEVMEQKGNLWVAFVPRAAAGRYKLVGPDGKFRPDPWARCYAYDDHGEISVSKAQGAHLERWPLFSGEGLPPRSLRVWVPAKKPTHHLYTHDGQNLFDPGAPHGGWRLQHAVGPSTLVIGIDHGPDRRAEMTHTVEWRDGKQVGGDGDRYAKLVREHVQPHIEARYGAPRRVGVMGSSLGGLVSYHLADRYENSYDAVISLSGTFGWGALDPKSNGDTMQSRYQRRVAEGRPLRRPIFYLDSGGVPGGHDNYDSNRRMADALADMGYRWNKDLWHWHEPGAPHTEASWAKRVFRPLRLFEAL